MCFCVPAASCSARTELPRGADGVGGEKLTGIFGGSYEQVERREAAWEMGLADDARDWTGGHARRRAQAPAHPPGTPPRTPCTGTRRGPPRCCPAGAARCPRVGCPHPRVLGGVAACGRATSPKRVLALAAAGMSGKRACGERRARVGEVLIGTRLGRATAPGGLRPASFGTGAQEVGHACSLFIVLLSVAAARGGRSTATVGTHVVRAVALGEALGVAARRRVSSAGRHRALHRGLRGAAVRLVVEVDGGYHAGRVRADARRDRELQRLGWRVVRVAAGVVERDIEAAVGRVVEAVR